MNTNALGLSTSPEGTAQQVPEDAHGDLLWHQRSRHTQQEATENPAHARAEGYSNLSNQAALNNQQMVASTEIFPESSVAHTCTQHVQGQNELARRLSDRQQKQLLSEGYPSNSARPEDSRAEVDTNRPRQTIFVLQARCGRKMPVELSKAMVYRANLLLSQWMITRLQVQYPDTLILPAPQDTLECQ